eukprot:m.134902 g.134902  ORF g.134902 m.134902 type:complete len:579 (+) comp16929_c0_seq8:21-1757(+)
MAALRRFVLFFGSLLLMMTAVCALPVTSKAKPNIVFLHCESTDARTYGVDSIVPIPNIRSVQKRGVNFVNHYVNVPICAPSRASLWSGRQPHNIPHVHNDIHVNGAWNNYEGVGNAPGKGKVTVDDILSKRLETAGYTTLVTGKTDYVAGGHSLTTMLDSWALYARFPYNIPKEGGWHIWGDCGGNATVLPGNESAHKQDWNNVKINTDWIRSQAKNSTPFFAYQGFNIVHPPYATSEEYWNRIPTDKIEIPKWKPLEELHPCDLQTTMKKGCALPDKYLQSDEHKLRVRRAYYAMVAEYDDMVGEYIKALDETGLTDSTWLILSSDHGDMQMEHQQFYKMVAYEPSTNVPLVIAGPNMGFNGQVTHLTSMVDLMPTFLDLAGAEITPDLDGQSLVPFLNTGQSPTHPTSVISQFHGENLVMSWYMIRNGNIKYVAWGTGKEHVPQLFNLSSDPEENINLATDPKHAPLVQAMDAKLRQQVDYPSVTMDVAQYNLDMARWWTTAEPDWQGILAGTAISKKFPRNQGQLNPDWGQLWEEGPEGYWKAWWDWVDSPPTINPCPSNLTYNWPPQASSATVP